MARVFKCWSSGWPVACQLGVSWSPGVWRPAEGGQYADCPPRKVESLQPGGPSGDQLKSVEKQKKKVRGGPGQENQVVAASGDQPKSVIEQSGEPPDRRTKWCPQAKWRPAEVGGRTSQGSPQDQVEDQVVVGKIGEPPSAGQVATSRSRSVVGQVAKSRGQVPRRGAPRRTKWSQEDQVVVEQVPPAQEDQVDPAKIFFAGQASVAEVGVSPTERLVSDACQDGCRDGLRPERSPAVGLLSVAVRLGGSPAEL